MDAVSVEGLEVAASVEVLDGPAAEGFAARVSSGRNRVGRCPTFIRAVLDANGEADLLDALDDEPAEGERVYAYRLSLLAHYRATQGGSGWHATYRWVEGAPPEIRERASWRRWCEAQG